MSVRVQRNGLVLIVIHSRPEVRNAVDPGHADSLNARSWRSTVDEAADAAVFRGKGGVFRAGDAGCRSGRQPIRAPATTCGILGDRA